MNYYYASSITCSSATVTGAYPGSAVAISVLIDSIRALNQSTTTSTSLNLYYYNATASTNTLWYTSSFASSFGGELLTRTIVLNPNDKITYSASPTSNVTLYFSALHVDRT